MGAFYVSIFDTIGAINRIDGPDSFKGGLNTATCLKITKEARAAKSTDVTRVTASRDLSELKNLGLLVQTGAGRATRYHVNLPGWGPTPEKDTAPI